MKTGNFHAPVCTCTCICMTVVFGSILFCAIKYMFMKMKMHARFFANK